MTAPTPPSFPDSLRSSRELSRPRPPPIVTKKAFSAVSVDNTPIDESQRVRRESSKKKRQSSLKKKTIQVTSPSDGDTIIVSTEELRQENRPKSADTLKDDSNQSLDSYNFADAPVQIPHKINPIPTSKFIDYGGKFIKQSDREFVPKDKIESQSWEKLNLNLARSLQINRHSFFHVFQAYYAGMCLLSLVILPSIHSISGNAVSTSDPVYLFYAYYGRYSLNCSYMFNFFVTLAALAGYDIVLGERRTVSHRPLTMVFMIKFGIVLCCLISIITNSVLVGLDDELYSSVTDERFGGSFGMPGWFSEKSKMDAVQSSFNLWKSLNMIRGFSGIINWLLCSLCLDKTRYYSVVDPRTQNHQKDLSNVQQL